MDARALVQTRPAKAMPLELVIFDMDEVLCRYDRPLRLRRLAAQITLRAPRPRVCTGTCSTALPG